MQILTRKERWGLSGLGWFLVISILFLMVYLLARTVYPFLAVTERVDANILVVEGWVHDFGIRATLQEFETGRYHHVFTTGGTEPGSAPSNSVTSAGVMADWLRDCGIPSEALQAVPSTIIGRDRTYNSALALRRWLRERNIPVRSMNIITEMAHARRTRLLYAKAFGSHVTVGVIAAKNQEYDPERWWRSSAGFREVIGEIVSYIYAKLFFHPTEHDS